MQTAYICIFQKSKTHCNEGIVPSKISNTSVYPLKHFHILYVANISVYFWSLSLSHLSLDFNAFIFYCLTFHLQKCCELKAKLLPMQLTSHIIYHDLLLNGLKFMNGFTRGQKSKGSKKRLNFCFCNCFLLSIQEHQSARINKWC